MISEVAEGRAIRQGQRHYCHVFHSTLGIVHPYSTTEPRETSPRPFILPIPLATMAAAWNKTIQPRRWSNDSTASPCQSAICSAYSVTQRSSANKAHCTVRRG